MNKAFKTGIIIIIGLLTVSCNLLQPLVINLLTNPLIMFMLSRASSVTPESSFTPTAATEASLIFSQCQFEEDCPEAVSLADYVDDIEPGREYHIEIPSDQGLSIWLAWYARTDSYLQQNLNNMEFFIRVNDEPIKNEDLFGYITIEETDGGLYPGFCIGAAISGWQTGMTYKLEYGYVITGNIVDGWYDYEPQTILHTFYITVY